MGLNAAVDITEELRPVDESGVSPSGAFIERDGQTFLVGGLVASTNKRFFPKASFAAGSRDIEEVLIGPSGNLYSFTTIHVSQGRATPYAIGYVDFDCGARVLAPIQEGADALYCDQRVTLRNDGTSWFVSPEGGQ